MTAPFCLVDAFAHSNFTGNPAGVVLLDRPADEAWMQSVGAEINHAETAFSWPENGRFRLKWFTPTVEIDLCGHATLATVHVMLQDGRVNAGDEVVFETKSGPLVCRADPDLPSLDFPSKPTWDIESPAGLLKAVPTSIIRVMRNEFDWCVELASEHDVLGFQPNFDAIFDLGLRGLCITAQADKTEADFVSRFFAPTSGVPEDHVTGSAHCALGPFWAEKLGKNQLTGYQASPRGGFVRLDVRGDRTILSGRARTVVKGTLTT